MRENKFAPNLLFDADGKYSNHRIPGMIVTDKGTLLVYCEARQAKSDWAMMDILLQRSVDFGDTFSPPIVLAYGTAEHPTVNNPVMVQDKNGRIHFLYCEDYGVDGGRVLHRYSDDDGIEWSEACDISYATLPEFRNVFAPGPGHGIRTRDGVLVIPVWMVPKYYDAELRSHKPSVISTVYSKDNGETWQCGEILNTTALTIAPNETVAASLRDGTVYLNIRVSLSGYRVHAYSKNGYSDWYDYEPDLALHDPGCFGSTVSFVDNKGRLILLFGNCASKSQRKNVTLKASLDEGRTWAYERLIDADRGGYVELATDRSGEHIYLVYEENYGERCYIVRFSRDDIVFDE